jgi:hypothetical protein
MTKVCSKCKIEQSIENFNNDKSSSKDGHFCWCKTCVSENMKNRNFPVSVTEKVCSKCGVLKKAEDFVRAKSNKTGLSSHCKDCIREDYEKNWDKISAKQAQYAEDHPEVGLKAKAKYYETHKEEVLARSAKNYADNREEILEKVRNDPKITERKRKKRLENLEESLRKEKISRDKRRSTQREHINRLNNQWAKKKIAEDPNFRLARLLRSRITKVIKKEKRNGSAVRDLGCTLEELRAHLESKFQPGMSWENHGAGKDKWNIDHIIPLASFDLTDRQHFILACHYLNLQPLWHTQNMKKGKKLIPLENMPKEFPTLWSDPSGLCVETL